MTPVLRLLADDLTGALDTAGALVDLCGPVLVPLALPEGRGGSLALDSATREAAATEVAARLAPWLPLLAGGDVAFKKIDSLLRGHVAAELAACLRAGPWRHCILAPAFPAQQRITRGGRQLARNPDGCWRAVGPAGLAAMLAATGLDARQGGHQGPLPPGISVFDAETDADLARIVLRGRGAAGPVLWCGTGGLAGALAGIAAVAPDTRLAHPVLGLFGSDNPATARQLEACGGLTLRLGSGDAVAGLRVSRLLHATGAALLSLDLPPGLGRAEAAARIAAAHAALLPRLPRPGTLIVAGGETLRGICTALGADALLATGQAMPGVPRAVLRGGTWDGLALVTKSGAFGEAGLWRDLLAGNGLLAPAP